MHPERRRGPGQRQGDGLQQVPPSLARGRQVAAHVPLHVREQRGCLEREERFRSLSEVFGPPEVSRGLWDTRGTPVPSGSSRRGLTLSPRLDASRETGAFGVREGSADPFRAGFGIGELQRRARRPDWVASSSRSEPKWLVLDVGPALTSSSSSSSSPSSSSLSSPFLAHRPDLSLAPLALPQEEQGEKEEGDGRPPRRHRHLFVVLLFVVLVLLPLILFVLLRLFLLLPGSGLRQRVEMQKTQKITPPCLLFLLLVKSPRLLAPPPSLLFPLLLVVVPSVSSSSFSISSSC